MMKEIYIKQTLKKALSVFLMMLFVLATAGMNPDNLAYAVGNDPSTAQSISFGKYYHGSFTDKGSHYYKFKTSSNKNATYSVAAAFTEGGDEDWIEVSLHDNNLAYVDEYGRTQTYSYYQYLWNQGELVSRTFSNLKTNSTYYVKIAHPDGIRTAPDKYSLKVTQTIEKTAGKKPTGQVIIRNTIANSAKKTNDVIWDKSKVKGATHYELNWRKKGASTWNKVTVGNTVRGTTNNLTIGALYEIRVRPVKAATSTTYAAYGAWSPTVYRYFHTTQKIRLASKSAGSFTMSWKRNPDATSYQVMFTTNSNGAGAANNINTVGANATSFTKTGLKSGVTYYVQVREIRKIGNISYIGNISCPVAVKVK